MPPFSTKNVEGPVPSPSPPKTSPLLRALGVEAIDRSYVLGVLQRAFRDPAEYWRRAVRLCQRNQGTSRIRQRILHLKNPEPYQEEIEFIRQNPDQWIPFPYAPVRTSEATVAATWDSDCGLPCVLHNGKRLYFCRKSSLAWAERQYRNYVDREGITGQGILSKLPHAYQAAEHCVEDGDIVLDIGCSEGLFALDNLSKASHLYLFEADPDWREPLLHTFAESVPDKVTLTMKYVGNTSSATSVRLVDAAPDNPNATYFLKMDIEGAERGVLESSREFLRRHHVKISCCVYHRQEDADSIGALLTSLGYTIRFSEGFMVPLFGKIKPPYFRRGVLYARNYS